VCRISEPYERSDLGTLILHFFCFFCTKIAKIKLKHTKITKKQKKQKKLEGLAARTNNASAGDFI
jgi:uncharacterized MAPEG superfamily protein